jgi:hypothetical protein
MRVRARFNEGFPFGTSRNEPTFWSFALSVISTLVAIPIGSPTSKLAYFYKRERSVTLVPGRGRAELISRRLTSCFSRSDSLSSSGSSALERPSSSSESSSSVSGS